MNLTFVLKFLKELSKNNNREWFEKNKPRYVEAKNYFDEFLEPLHASFVTFDESLAGLNPKKLAFRIYRDVRFGKNKLPYKTNMGAGLSSGGKSLQLPGYYIHIEPGNKSFIATGLYMPPAEMLAAVRQEIDYNGEALMKIIRSKNFQKYFDGLDKTDTVKTAPRGYAKDHPHIDLLKLKSFTVSHPFADAEVTDKNFYKKVAKVAKAAKPLHDFLNEALA